MSYTKDVNGAKFTRFLGPLLDALRALGGTGTIDEVVDQIARDLKIPQTSLDELLESGAPKVRNQIQWARFYLMKEGLLTNSQRGVWTLSEQGRHVHLTSEQGRELFLRLVKRFQEERKNQIPSDATSPGISEEEKELSGHRDEVLALLKNLPPSGFERFCQALLREAGFTEVVVTGKSGDGGIDGCGTLAVNPLVSFKVLFQCKRFKDVVGPGLIRDFRGAMQGRADKGIFLTTGSFTSEARREANRDGAAPIELIDSEKLISLMEQFRFGLKPVQIFQVDRAKLSEFVN